MDPPFPCDMPSTRPASPEGISSRPSILPLRPAQRTQQLSNNALDRSAPQHSKRVATVGGDNLVVLLHRRVHADRNSFLFAMGSG